MVWASEDEIGGWEGLLGEDFRVRLQANVGFYRETENEEQGDSRGRQGRGLHYQKHEAHLMYLEGQARQCSRSLNLPAWLLFNLSTKSRCF